MTTPYPTRRTGLGRPLADIVGAHEPARPGLLAGPVLPAPGVVPLDLVPFPMVVADPVGRVLAVNQRWVRLTGLSASQSMGSGWLSALRPQDRSALGSLVQAVGRGAQGRRASFGLEATGSAQFGWWLVAYERAGERLVGIAVGEAPSVRRDPVMAELPALLRSVEALLRALDVLVARLPLLEPAPAVVSVSASAVSA